MFSRRSLLQSFCALPFFSFFNQEKELPYVPSGVKAFDKALGGGFAKGKVTLITRYTNKHALFAGWVNQILTTKAVVFSGNYGEPYVGWYEFKHPYNATPELIHADVDEALKNNQAVVFITSKLPVICRSSYYRHPDYALVVQENSITALTLKTNELEVV